MSCNTLKELCIKILNDKGLSDAASKIEQFTCKEESSKKSGKTKEKSTRNLSIYQKHMSICMKEGKHSFNDCVTDWNENKESIKTGLS